MWLPGSTDTVCPRPPLMTRVQHFVSRIKKRQRWDVQTMWAIDLDLWPWRSRRLPLIQVYVLHPHINFEILRPYRSEDMAHFVLVGLWPWPFDLETGAHCRTVVPSCQFWWYYDYSFSIYGPLGQHGSDWSRDLVTLTCDFGGRASAPDAGRRPLSVYQVWSS